MYITMYSVSYVHIKELKLPLSIKMLSLKLGLGLYKTNYSSKMLDIIRIYFKNKITFSLLGNPLSHYMLSFRIIKY